MNKPLRLCMLPIVKQLKYNRYAYFVVDQPVCIRHSNEDIVAGNSYWQDKYTEVKNRVMSEWEECRDSSPSSMRGVFYSYVQRAKAQIDPHEMVMVEMSDTVGKTDLEIICPSSESVDVVRTEFKRKLTRLHYKNTLYMAGYIALVPITMLATVLPGPNVFFACNALRLYSLYMSRKSIKGILSLSEDTDPEASSCIDDSGNESTVKRLYFTPSESPSVNWLDTQPENQTGFSGVFKNIVLPPDVLTAVIAELLPSNEVQSTEEKVRNFMKYNRAIS